MITSSQRKVLAWSSTRQINGRGQVHFQHVTILYLPLLALLYLVLLVTPRHLIFFTFSTWQLLSDLLKGQFILQCKWLLGFNVSPVQNYCLNLKCSGFRNPGGLEVRVTQGLHVQVQILARLICHVSQNKGSGTGELDPRSFTLRVLETHWKERGNIYHWALTNSDELKKKKKKSESWPAQTAAWRVQSSQMPCDSTSKESCGFRVRVAAANDLESGAQRGTCAWSL